ncbi:hypothetical protein Tco_0834680 [Tanacetum coccineum]
MKIPSWMITDEIKLTDHYRMHAVIFGVDIPMTRSQLIKSTQGTHRTPSTPRSPNPELDEVESSALRKSTVIRLRIPQRRSTRLTPPTLIPKTDEADDIILQDIIASINPILNKDILKNIVLITNTPYPSRKIRRIRACTHQRPQRKQAQYAVSREGQYAVLEISVETEFPAIAFNNEISFEKTLSCEPTVSSLNDEIDFRILFDDSDDEDTEVFDKSFCFDDLDFFKDFENGFPAIVYNDAQASKSDLLTELILRPQHIDEFDLKNETSLSEHDEEEQKVLYFNDLFPFNIIHPDDLKSEKTMMIMRSIKYSLRELPFDPKRIIKDGFNKECCVRQDMLFPTVITYQYLRGLPNLMAQGLGARMLMEHRDAQGIRISSARDFLSTAPSYTTVRDPILRLRHRLIACSIAGKSQAPEESGALISGGEFVTRLAKHFGLLTEERLRGLTVIGPELLIIDMVELVRLQICMEINDTWAWVAIKPERKPDIMAGAPGVAQDAPTVDEGDQPVPAPVQAPPPPPAAATTMS